MIVWATPSQLSVPPCADESAAYQSIVLFVGWLAFVNTLGVCVLRYWIGLRLPPGLCNSMDLVKENMP